ncbi:uncharacterized protein BDV14DRAFT_198484 [Aspergillus stella-maris]|uniref:uncharacterized protein n=1 Tax=Aspergillus stella-maris TaxID=1810926 RepID=UPI003CCCFB28
MPALPIGERLPPFFGTCHRCQSKNAPGCSLCFAAPEFNPGDVEDFYYCSKKCRHDDRPFEFHRCKRWHERRTAFRAAKLIRIAFLAYRRRHYDIDLERIEFKDNTVYMYQKEGTGVGEREPGPFPADVTSNDSLREVALCKYTAGRAISLLGPMTRSLLKKVTKKIEVIEIEVSNPEITVVVVPDETPTEEHPHDIIKITLRSGEEWVLDPNGLLYGFKEVCMPYGKYMASRCRQIVKGPTPYTAQSTDDLDSFLIRPFSVDDRKRAELYREREVRLHFNAMVLEGVKMHLMSGLPNEFRANCVGFNDFVLRYMDQMRQESLE